MSCLLSRQTILLLLLFLHWGRRLLLQYAGVQYEIYGILEAVGQVLVQHSPDYGKNRFRVVHQLAYDIDGSHADQLLNHFYCKGE